MPILPDLNEIKNLRKRLNLTQEELQIALSIPQATISRIENGLGNPSYLTVKKIFDYLEHEKLSDKKEEINAEDIMSRKIISIDSKSSIKDVVNLMNKHDLSQIPIIDDDKNIGSITSKKIQNLIAENHDLINIKLEIIKELPFPEIEKDWPLKDVSNLLSRYPAVLVKEHGNYVGIITDADFLKAA
ncbi:MAG: CBS domain-containing protein [Promethearchaeota archaeon]|nr:MAG: CBS domain-containing protein [Candidatus Lokiarchaeota archaeon]